MTTSAALPFSFAVCSIAAAIGPMKPYEIKIPKNVPTSAAPTLWPIEAVSAPSSEAIVFTIPSTAATMPKPGSASATF